jgi:hypothetical protein
MRNKAASTIIERLNTGTFGDGVQLKGSYGDIPEQHEAGETDAAVERKVGPVPQTLPGYRSGEFIGGMGGDVPWPFATGRYTVTESDSADSFPQFSSNDGKVRKKPSGGTIEKGSATDPIETEGAGKDGGSL